MFAYIFTLNSSLQTYLTRYLLFLGRTAVLPYSRSPSTSYIRNILRLYNLLLITYYLLLLYATSQPITSKAIRSLSVIPWDSPGLPVGSIMPIFKLSSQ